VQVPGHPDEVAAMLRAAATSDEKVYIRLSEQRNATPRPVTGRLDLVRRSSGPTAALLLAVGPMLDPVLRATEGMDVAVAYTNTPRPFDSAGLRVAGHTTVVLVEPYLAGTSSRLVSDALRDVPHRLLALGVDRADLRRYGTPADHARWHHLDPAGIRASVEAFL
jgi:transketolase